MTQSLESITNARLGSVRSPKGLQDVLVRRIRRCLRTKAIQKTLVAISFSSTAALAPLSLPNSVSPDLLVATSLNQSIEWFADNGPWIDTFGSTRTSVPDALAASPIAGGVAVGTYAHNVQEYSGSSRFLGTFRIPQSGATSAGVTFDRQDQLYVMTHERGQGQARNGYLVTINRYDVASDSTPVVLSSSPTGRCSRRRLHAS